MEVGMELEGGHHCCEKKTTWVQWITGGLFESGFITVGLNPIEDGIMYLRGGEA
jgi:hypothetical protein